MKDMLIKSLADSKGDTIYEVCLIDRYRSDTPEEHSTVIMLRSFTMQALAVKYAEEMAIVIPVSEIIFEAE